MQELCVRLSSHLQTWDNSQEFIKEYKTEDGMMKFWKEDNSLTDFFWFFSFSFVLFCVVVILDCCPPCNPKLIITDHDI